MTMRWTTYVGPFLECHRDDIDMEKHEHLICNGRCEAGVNEKLVRMIANIPIEGITRAMHLEGPNGDDVQWIEPATIVVENAAFGRMVAGIVSELDQANAWYRLSWGIVPCCS